MCCCKYCSCVEEDYGDILDNHDDGPKPIIIGNAYTFLYGLYLKYIKRK